MQNSIFEWGSRFPLNDTRLAPLRDYLAAAAASSIPLDDLEGNVVASESLLSPWAVLLFSEREEIRRLPTVGAQGFHRVRYRKLLLAEMLTALAVPGATPPKTNRKASPVTIVIDRSVTNIDQRRQRLTLEQRNTNVQTTNNRELGIANGSSVEVLRIDRNSLTLRDAAATRTLAHDNTLRESLAHGRVLNMHRAQGLPVDRAITVMDSHDRKLNSKSLFYLLSSRALEHLGLHVDSQSGLAEAVGTNRGDVPHAQDVVRDVRSLKEVERDSSNEMPSLAKD